MSQAAPHDFPDNQNRKPAGVAYRRVDVAIVGGGLGGSILANVLGRAGIAAAVVDLHAVHPPEFKAEKLAGDQIDMLQRLGLLDCLAAKATPIDETISARHSRAIDRQRRTEYGIAYQDMVGAVRARLPENAELIVGRVGDVTAGPELQTVTLADGRVIEARLLTLATGTGGVLRQKLGIGRRVVRDAHSLSMAFDIEAAAGKGFQFGGLTYYGERVADRIDYVSLFPIGGAMRANLFCYRDAREEWSRAFSDRPAESLLAAMPGIRRFLGDFRVAGKVQTRVVDLQAAENYCRDGVVMLGDAFQTTCPSTGTGISKLLTDIEQLAHHVPRWLATPGMGAAKIVQYYDDPAKRACDARSSAWSEYRRSVTIDPSLGWEVHRRRVYLRRRVQGWLDQVISAPVSAASSPRAA